MARSILSTGQRRLLTALLVASAFMLGNAAFLWLSPPEASVLPVFYQWMLVSHVVVGIALLIPMAVFILWHLRRALAMRNPRAVATGMVLASAMIGLAFTGLFMKEQGNSADNRWAYLSHQVLAFVIPLGYGVHRWLARNRPQRAAVFRGVLAPVGVLVVALGIHHATMPEAPPPPQAFVPRPPEGVDPFEDAFPDHGPGGADPSSVFYPASTETRTQGFLSDRLLVDDDLLDPEQHAQEIEHYGFTIDASLGAATCVRCHADTVDQWSRSAHRFASFNNPFYRAAVEDLRAHPDRGKERAQWCAGCHDPAVMMAGDWMGDVDPHMPRSQAGLTCMACHAMDEVDGVGGNGGYRISDDTPDPYLFADAKDGIFATVNDLLVKAKPDVHKREMLKPVFRTSEYCATCHKVSLDTPVNRYRWVRGQNEYDNWHDSGVARNAARTFYLPETARSCQDCHMPLVDAPLGDVAAKNGKIRSHLFLGPNTALPHIRGDERTLEEIRKFREGALRVDVFAVRRADGELHEAPDLRDIEIAAGEEAEVHVVVRNKDVGHTFPGGTTDSNESWIHLRVTLASDPDTVLFESGTMDAETRVVDQDAHHYRTVFVDEHARPQLDRNAADFRAVVHSKNIGPGTADLVRYAFRVPEHLAGERLRVEATLRWRKFRRDYTEFVWRKTMPGRPVPELPIDDLAMHTVELPVVSGTPAAPDAVPAGTLAEQWVRWNDWGIGMLLQGDTVGAKVAWGRMGESDPERVDPWRNLARVALRDGNLPRGLEMLKKAESLDPGNAQTAFFFGVALEKAGRLEQSVEAYERAKETFPDDRTIHAALGRLRYNLGEYEDALLDVLRVLAIDPEDREAHYRRFQIYQALGDDEAAALAEKAYRKYWPDESAQKWTEAYRRADPAANREDQSVHLHRLELLR
jgi:tetratricopeptide (TPR) repeat protein